MITIVSCGHKPDDERIYHREIRSLSNAGYSIQYFTRCNGEIDLSSGNLIHINLQRNEYSLRKYIQFIVQNIEHTDILHIHEFDLLPLAKKLKKKCKTEVIYDVHDTLRAMWDTFSTKKWVVKKLINSLLSAFEKYHLQFVDEVILANQPFEKTIYKKRGLPETIVENFPIIDRLNAVKPQKENPIILYQGQVSSDRGLSQLLDAFKLVLNFDSSIQLQIIGPPRSEEFSKTLKQKVSQLGCENNVEIIDDIPHDLIWSYMENATIGVIPSLNFPRVMVDTPTKLFEYMASGCVVVATDLPPVRYFLEGAGEIVISESPKAIASAIIKLLSNPDLYESHFQAGILKIQNEYNWDISEKRLIELYNKISL